MALRVKKRIPLHRRSDRLAQRVQKREQRRQTIHRVVTVSVVLVVLASAAGLAYTWYLGQSRTVAIQNPPARKIRPTIVVPKISPNAPLGVSVQTVTTPVKPGENALITIRTNPLADCTIVVKDKATTQGDSGLAKKAADEFGVVSWAWTVKPSEPAGSLPINVGCKNKKHSAVVVSEVVVTAS